MGRDEDDILGQLDSEMKKASESSRVEFKDSKPVHLIVAPGKLLSKTPKVKRAKLMICVTHYKVPTDSDDDRPDTRTCMKSFGSHLPCPNHCAILERAEKADTRIIQRQASRIRDKETWKSFHLQGVQVNDPNIAVREAIVGAGVAGRFRDAYVKYLEATGTNLFSWEHCTPIGIVRTGKGKDDTRYWGIHEPGEGDDDDRPKKFTLMDKPYKGRKVKLKGYGVGMNNILKALGITDITVTDLSKQVLNLEQTLLEKATTDQEDGEQELLEFLGLSEREENFTKPGKLGGKKPQRQIAEAEAADGEEVEGEEAAESGDEVPDEEATEGGDEQPEEAAEEATEETPEEDSGGAFDENGEPVDETQPEDTAEEPAEDAGETVEDTGEETVEEGGEEAPEETGDEASEGEDVVGGDEPPPADEGLDDDAKLDAMVNSAVSKTNAAAATKPAPKAPVKPGAGKAPTAPPKPAAPAPKPPVAAAKPPFRLAATASTPTAPTAKAPTKPAAPAPAAKPPTKPAAKPSAK